MALSVNDLEQHLKTCLDNQARQEHHVAKVREQLAQAETNLREWNGAVKSTEILIEQARKAEPAPTAAEERAEEKRDIRKAKRQMPEVKIVELVTANGDGPLADEA
jgi:small-conductance mechanosensitive channel